MGVLQDLGRNPRIPGNGSWSGCDGVGCPGERTGRGAAVAAPHEVLGWGQLRQLQHAHKGYT